MTQRQTDIVEAFQQALATERIDHKAGGKAVLVTNGLVFERNGQLIVRDRIRALQQRCDLFLGKRDQQNAVLRRV